MKYTEQTPTENGYYFCKCVGRLSGNIYSTVVNVYGPEDYPPDTVFWDGTNYHITDDSFTAWAGPIEEPTE